MAKVLGLSIPNEVDESFLQAAFHSGISVGECATRERRPAALTSAGERPQAARSLSQFRRGRPGVSGSPPCYEMHIEPCVRSLLQVWSVAFNLDFSSGLTKLPDGSPLFCSERLENLV